MVINVQFQRLSLVGPAMEVPWSRIGKFLGW